MKIYPWSLKLHRYSALVLLLFVSTHITNHIFAYESIAAHKAFMEAARMIYRHPVLESLVILCVITQCITGGIQLAHVWGKWPNIWHKIQVFSGIYLLLFMINHTIAILFTLRVWLNLDSDFYAAAGGLHISPLHWFFVPYYLLGVIAFFAHIGSFLYFRARVSGKTRIFFVSGVIGTGIVISIIIISAFSGLFYDIELPDNVRSSYEQIIGKR